MPKNPVMQQKYEQGYERGKQDMADLFKHKFASLTDIPGIGKEMEQRILRHVFGIEGDK